MKNRIREYILFSQKNIWEIFLVSFFILHLQVSTVSNYKTITIVIKIVSTTFLVLICYLDSIKKGEKLLSIFFTKENKLFLSVLGLFFLIPLISLTYSFNQSFGLIKYLLIIFNTIPTIVVFYYLFVTRNSNREKVFVTVITMLAISSSIIVITLKPFSHDGNYAINFSNWSHVIFGRFIGVAVIIFFCFYIYENKHRMFYLLPTIVGFIALLLSEFRAGILSVSLVSGLLLITNHFLPKQKKANIIKLSVILFFFIIATITFELFVPDSRMESLVKNFTQEEFVDRAVNARERAYKYAFEAMVEYPLSGVGTGGFYNEEISGEVALIKYPHNIFLEIGSEYGIIVLLLFIVILIKSFKQIYHIHPGILAIFLYVLLLAQFSKDVPSQVQFLISLVFLGNFTLRNTVIKTK